MDIKNTTPSLSGTLSPKQSMTGLFSSKSKSLKGSITKAVHVVTNDYDDLINKPMIEGNILENDKTYEELGLNRITNSELEDILL